MENTHFTQGVVGIVEDYRLCFVGELALQFIGVEFKISTSCNSG